MLNGLPGSSASQETNLLTLVYFCVGGLELIDASDALKKRRRDLIDFVYSLQSHGEIGGFFGNLNDATQNRCRENQPEVCIGTNIAMTFAGLATLLTLGDDLTSIDRHGIVRQLMALQTAEGSFCGAVPLKSKMDVESGRLPLDGERTNSEADMRFVFCAAVISFIIRDWSGVNVHTMQKFIWSCRSYEGGFSQVSGAESHGGSTYCAVAALYLIFLSKNLGLIQNSCEHCDRMTTALFGLGADGDAPNYIRDELIAWCLFRQGRGFNGRPNKPEDSCYTFWIGAVLKMTNAYEFVSEDLLEEFCMETQDGIIGGFAKWPGSRSDPLHAYLTISGLSLLPRYVFVENSLDFEDGNTDEKEDISLNFDEWKLKAVHPALNISMPAFLHLSTLFRAA
ncbi:geranylgeranyl transferase type-1 subunit beta-like [Paramacrobiotus metropolitanus]|uniref:geranylgeranyl transferase type-1 subunit beta-like n=1 Tax=Paramacrobiotus metropolitanus TaxID=2943436 RepID=UPI0024465437|nr:geranylgeranyl transferase type-1 subunit beta-like [Paramacrobiotus metropolitanus]